MNLCSRSLLATLAVLWYSHGASADGCGNGFKVCTGASSATTPQINTPEFANLFVDIVQSSLPSSSKRSLGERASMTSLCCNELLSCLTMHNIGIPFCYDKFTTNYVLPDGASGTISNGSYKNVGGDTANLESGVYTLSSGQTGNIYALDPQAKPNTATLPIPTQFTASGIGSAVPLTSLGILTTFIYTTTIPGSVIPPSTIPPSTVSGSTLTETRLLPTNVVTVSGSSTITLVQAATSLSVVVVPASVVAGTTVPASTVAPVVSVVTSIGPAAATTKTKNGAGRPEVRSGLMALGVLLLALI